MANPKYDVIIWGATGYTGRLIAEYFAVSVTWRSPAIRWAIAGRSQAKLLSLKSSVVSLAEDEGVVCGPGVIVASATDQASIDAMVQESRVVVGAAGPFTAVGTPVVDACVRLRKDYVDVTGEIPWVRGLIDAYGATAEKNKVKIVNMCGFDSVPSDMGTLFVVNALKRRGAATRRVRNFAALRGGLSGGTVASGLEMDGETAAQMANEFLLGGAPAGGVREEDADVSDAAFVPDLNAWIGPFMMAGLNTRVVRRSNMMLGYGQNFSYTEAALASSEQHARKLTAAQSKSTVELRKAMVAAGKLPKPGQGPSKEERAKGFFKMHFSGDGDDGQTVYATVSGGEGYGETAKMVSEAALLLVDGTTLPNTFGVITPAFAFGEALIGRLEDAGTKFELHEHAFDFSKSKL